MDGTKIAFHYLPYDPENKQHAVEKSENADGKEIKNRYLYGVTSGTKIDGHGERITEKCIKSFLDQTNSGTILLYPDSHGIKASEDVGILTKGEIKPDGNWWTEYRLYRPDEVGAAKSEKIETIWRQVNGLKPYPRRIQKGFSIEGYIPPDGIQSGYKDISGNGTNRVIDNIVLDGVVLVGRPAYTESVANAIYKALGEMRPEQEERFRGIVKNRLGEIIQGNEINDMYYKSKWEINDAFESEIETVMKSRRAEWEKTHRLGILFDEYASLMKNLIMKSQSLFERKDDEDGVIENSQPTEIEKVCSRERVMKQLYVELTKLKKLYTR